jgi:hypothetical protein
VGNFRPPSPNSWRESAVLSANHLKQWRHAMEVSISRRSLAIGGPAALAASSLGQIGVIGALVGTHVNAAAGVTLSIPAFAEFYQGKLNPYMSKVNCMKLAEVMAEEMDFAKVKKYDAADVLRNGTRFRNDLQYLNEALGVFQINMPSISNPAESKMERWKRKVKFLLEVQISQDERPFAANDITAYRVWLTQTLTDPELNVFKQHYPAIWHWVMRFLEVILRTADFSAFQERVKQIEASDDRRRLRVGNPDSLRDKTNIFGTPNGELEVVFGNKTQPVEKEELKDLNSWQQTMFWGEHTYSKLNLVRSGINCTEIAVSPANSTYLNMTGFALGQDQIDGINYYVNKDIAANGAYAGMTPTQSADLLRCYAMNAYRYSGHVYGSYELATYFARGTAQALISLTRYWIKGKYLNLPALADATLMFAQGNPSAMAMAQKLRGSAWSLVTIATSLGSIMIGMCGFLDFTLRESAEAFKTGRLKNFTAAQTADLWKSRLAQGLAGIGGFFQGAALLNLGVASIQTLVTGRNTEIATRAVGGMFALSDTMTSVMELFAFGDKASRQQLTDADAASLTATFIKLAGGLYGGYESQWRFNNGKWLATDWTWIPAIKVSTYTAGAASIFFYTGAFLKLNKY